MTKLKWFGSGLGTKPRHLGGMLWLIERIGWVLMHLLPRCEVALRMAERGTRRPLRWHERLLLAYHRPLCPFCACNKNRFDSLCARQIKTAPPSSKS